MFFGKNWVFIGKKLGVFWQELGNTVKIVFLRQELSLFGKI